MSIPNYLVRFTVVSSTPLLIGGFDGNACRDVGGRIVCEGVRSQSVKGVWRWFTRSFIAGALHASGYSSREFTKGVIELVSKLLGYTMGKHSQASKIKLIVYTNRDDACSPSALRALEKHQRVALLRLGGKDERFVLSSITCRFIQSASIALYPRVGVSLSNIEEALAVSTLLLSFILGCLGKGSRRGLGCFDIEIRRLDYLPLYIRNTRIASCLSRNIPPPPDAITDLILFTWRVVAQYVGVSALGKGREELPPVPSIAPRVFRLFYAKVSEDPLDIAIAFSRAVTRLSRALILKTDTMNDPLYVRKSAWVLGLPRKQRNTGYYEIRDERGARLQRRASPFMLAVHRGYALLSVFYSLDWPACIEWKDGASCSIRIDRSTGEVTVYMNGSSSRYSLRDLIDHALGVLLDVMGRQGYEFKEVSINW